MLNCTAWPSSTRLSGAANDHRGVIFRGINNIVTGDNINNQAGAVPSTNCALSTGFITGFIYDLSCYQFAWVQGLGIKSGTVIDQLLLFTSAV